MLYAHFALRNQQAFQRLLGNSRAAPTLALSSSGGGRSWNKPSPLSGATPTCDEGRWYPLHRALYMGTWPLGVYFDPSPVVSKYSQAVKHRVLLLQKGDSDTSLKDYEGYTAFDLYNSTVERTKPEASGPVNMFAWGTNRNAALGLDDGADRAYPEQVFIPPQTEHPAPHTQPLSKRFQPIRVLDVSMAKLHTAAVTAEPYANLRLCGFGDVVRGAAQHRLAPLKIWLSSRTAMIRTSSRSRLVKIILSRSRRAGLGTGALQMVATPRRVVGPLKKELVIGVAACKTASACWTAKELFTWGTNNAL
ncbi:hypothetical protein DFH11DRAFT_1734775 [Phellopilus nigrolimitatus]|nr:hypothetical protein DFH11DRAFT_1734775 [Phellopilus nigrolimitatus]